jgi:hypothetical protein
MEKVKFGQASDELYSVTPKHEGCFSNISSAKLSVEA